MVKRRQAQQAESDNHFADDEVSRIVQQAGMQNQAGEVQILRPKDLDELVLQQQNTAKLIQLDDEDLAVGFGELDAEDDDDEGAKGPGTGDEYFYLLLNSICFGTLWLCLDMMIHAQYSQDVTVANEWRRGTNVLPGLIFIIFVSSRYPNNTFVRIVMFGFSTIGGAHLVYIVNKATYMAVIKKAPALATLAIWSVVQLDLVTVLVSLSIVGAYVKYAGLNIIKVT